MRTLLPKILQLLTCWFLGAGSTSLLAQQELSVTVHVNRLPTGTYPTKLYQFANTPGLVSVTLTNHTSTVYNLYLNGTLTGDNGVLITTAKGYQPASITINAFETKTLNAIEAGSLFDPNSLVYMSGSVNIKPSVFGEQSLPEGTYQACVRAYNTATHQPLSPEEPIGCSNIFTVTTLEPPMILSPIDQDSLSSIDPQNVSFRWTTPPGSPPSIQYKLTLVEIFGDRNPNDAILSTTNPFFETTVTGAPIFLYSMQYPRLAEGRHYAMQVTANDPSGNSTFRNQGKSEVIQFLYGRSSLLSAVDANALQAANGSQSCPADCTGSLADTRPKTDLSAIQVGSILEIDGFNLTISTITGKSNGLLSGEGAVAVPILQGFPVSVSFQDVQINAANQVIAGTAVAKRRGDATAMLSDFDPANPNKIIDPNQAQSFGQYIAAYSSNNLGAQPGGGYSLPLAISNSTPRGSNPIIVAITNLQLGPQHASCDAAATFEIPEAQQTAALGARGICFSKDKGLCGQGLLFLEQNLTLGQTGLSLKVTDGTDPGTYIEFGTGGFSRLRIRGEYTFRDGLMQNKGGGVLKAQLTVESATSWSDWVASVTLEPFKIPGNNDFNFYPGSAFYDHSDLRNPDGMPADYPEGTQPTWRGFIIPSLQVELPPIIRSFAGDNRQIAPAQNFVIDDLGLSGSMTLDNLLPIDQGNMGSWQYSVDHIETTFLRNSFVRGNMIGKLLLPIANDADPNSLLDYTCTLSGANAAPGSANSLSYQFAIKPKDNIDVPMWWVHMNVDKSSSVWVTVNQEVFQPQARLNGSVTLKPDLGSPLNKVQISAITFQELTINSTAPYLGDGKLTMSQSIPVGWMNGLPVSFSEPPKFTPDKLGLLFSIDITLADIANIPKAHTTFSLLGGLDLVGGRLKTRPAHLEVNQIGLDGFIGPVKVAGYVKFFDGDPKFGNGVEGVLQEATFPPGFTVRASALFGRQDYNYFFVGASFNLPPPAIPIGGGVVPLSIYGFGGGVYYNMTMQQEPMAVQNINVMDPMSLYTPQAGITGFKGSVTLGSTDGSIFVAMGTLSVEMDRSSMAIHKLAVNIDGAMYTQLADISNGMIRGSGLIQYDFSQDELAAGITMNIDLKGLVKGSGSLGLLTNFSTGDWYFKMGDAAPEGQKVSLSFSAFDLVKFTFAGYQNVGNKLTLPATIQGIYDAVSGRLVMTDPAYKDPQTQKVYPIPKLAGVLLGASASPTIDLEFLIFYLKLEADLGFDLALIANAGKCDDGSLAGINGYYAAGDIYAGGSFDFGLSVNVWFFKGRISVTKVGFKTTLAGGFPNPFVFDGWLEGEYSVLDGLVSGHMNFHAKYSSAGDAGCKLVTNPFGGMPLVNAVYPGDGDANISIMTNLNIAFNFPVNQEFSVKIHDENTGKEVPKNLLVVLKKFRITEQGGSGYDYAGYMNEDGSSYTEGGCTIEAIYHNALLYGWVHALDPQSRYKITLTVYGFQRDDNGNWQEVTDARIQDSTLYFTTGDCVQRLDAGVSLGQNNPGKQLTGSSACASYPFPYQRYFLPGQRQRGYVQVIHDIPCMMAPPSKLSPMQVRYSLVTVTGYDLVAQFVSTKDIFESPVTQEGVFFAFDIPALSPSTVYKLRMVKRPIYKDTGPGLTAYLDQLRTGTNPVSTRTETLAQDPENGSMKNYVVVKNYTADASISVKRPDDIEIYLSYFKTSKYRTLQDKISSAFQTGPVSWNFLMPFFQVSMVEGLDTYDANGYAYDGSGSGSNDWIIPPLINLDEKYEDNPWMQNVIAPLVAQYDRISPFDPESAFNSMWKLNSPAGNTGYHFNVKTYVSGREPFMVAGFDQPLQSSEIPVLLNRNSSNIYTAPSAAAGALVPAGGSAPIISIQSIPITK
jgi:hypothetical protein